MAKITISNLGKIQLKRLRSDVVLNSLFVADYNNRYNLDTHEVCNFFDGFMDFIDTLCREAWEGTDQSMSYDEYWTKNIWHFDTPENLWDYYCMVEW